MTQRPRGYVLIEVILASALLLLLVVAFGGALLYGQEVTVLSANRAQAVFWADEALEAVRNIRDEDYDGLVNGTYGLITTGGVWSLSGVQDVDGIFTRTVTIANAGSGVKAVTAEVTWQQNAQRTGSVMIITQLSAWSVPPPPPEPPPSP